MALSPDLTFPRRFIICLYKKENLTHSRRWKYECRRRRRSLVHPGTEIRVSWGRNFACLGLIIITFAPHSSSPWLVYQHLHSYLHLLLWVSEEALWSFTWTTLWSTWTTFVKCIWRAPYIYICEYLSLIKE